MRAARWFVCLGLGALAGSLVFLPASARPADQQDEKKGKPVTLDNLQSRVPGDWVEEPGNRFRIKQYRLPAVKDDKDNAEVVIFHFGQGQGGSVNENVKRWKGMFVPPEGKTLDDVLKIDKMKVSGNDVTYVDLHGTYIFRARPQDSETARRPNYRMLAVVFESEKGPYFLRMVGPADTVECYKKGFDEWVKGFK
jgi:hypothetical protein